MANRFGTLLSIGRVVAGMGWIGVVFAVIATVITIYVVLATGWIVDDRLTKLFGVLGSVAGGAISVTLCLVVVALGEAMQTLVVIANSTHDTHAVMEKSFRLLSRRSQDDSRQEFATPDEGSKVVADGPPCFYCRHLSIGRTHDQGECVLHGREISDVNASTCPSWEKR